LPSGEIASVDADASAGRDGDTVRVAGSGEVVVADGRASVCGDERLAITAGPGD
jgi:hypothetical protein